MTVQDGIYLERLLDDIDSISRGRPNAISDDRWLVNNYDPGKFRLIEPFLSFDDRKVVADVILLLTCVRERAAMGRIEKMDGFGDAVSMARLGYLTSLRQDDEAIPEIMDVLAHKRGQEFILAARRMGTIGRVADVPALRRIYGQVGGAMKDEVRIALERIISRNPELQATSDLILSCPVYPNENEFEEFLDKSIDYLDVKYRANVYGKKQISSKVHANVSRALRVMRTRLYNEADNLSIYGVDKEDRWHELADLMKWANDDLSSKEVQGPDVRKARVCPKCGGMMTCYKGIWMCPECGGDLRTSVLIEEDSWVTQGATSGVLSTGSDRLNLKEKSKWHTEATGTETTTGPGNSSRPSARTARRSARSPSSPLREGPSTAGTASESTSPPTEAGTESPGAFRLQEKPFPFFFNNAFRIVSCTWSSTDCPPG